MINILAVQGFKLNEMLDVLNNDSALFHMAFDNRSPCEIQYNIELLQLYIIAGYRDYYQVVDDIDKLHDEALELNDLLDKVKARE